MKIRNTLFSSLLLFVLTLAACAPKASSTPDAMMSQDTATPAAMMHDTSTPDTMMQTTATPDAMMHATTTPDIMMMHETPTADAMMNSTPGSTMAMANWLGTSLTDAVTGKGFKVSDFNGKVVLVETMAVWCSNCHDQQVQIQNLDKMMMDHASEFVSVSLDIDPHENTDVLKKYVGANSFDWSYAVAPAELIRTIGQTYGDQFLNPPSTPILIIDRHGIAHPLPFGLKSADDLMKTIQKYINM